MNTPTTWPDLGWLLLAATAVGAGWCIGCWLAGLLTAALSRGRAKRQ